VITRCFTLSTWLAGLEFAVATVRGDGVLRHDHYTSSELQGGNVPQSLSRARRMVHSGKTMGCEDIAGN
jgi:hypothetical protein